MASVATDAEKMFTLQWCLAGKRLSEISRADQKLHYVDNFDQCPFEEYTIDAVTHNAVENTKSYPKQLFTTVRVNSSV